MQRIQSFFHVVLTMLIFGLVPMISMGVVAWSAYDLYRLSQHIAVVDEQVHGVLLIEELDINLLQKSLLEKDYLLSGDQVYLDAQDAADLRIEAILGEVAHLSLTPREVELLATLDRLRGETNATNEQVVQLYQAGRLEEATEVSLNETASISEEVFQVMEDLAFYGEAALHQEALEIEALVAQTLLVGVGGLVLLPILGIAAYLLTSRITHPFLVLNNAMLAVRGGIYRPDLLGVLPFRKDSFGRLAVVLSERAEAIAAEEAALAQELAGLENRLREKRRRRLVVTAGQAFMRSEEVSDAAN